MIEIVDVKSPEVGDEVTITAKVITITSGGNYIVQVSNGPKILVKSSNITGIKRVAE